MNARLWVMIACGVVIALIILLASSLGRLEFQPARPFGFAPGSTDPLEFPSLEVLEDTPVWQILVLWLALVVTLGLGFLLLPPEIRKRILRQFISFALGVLLLILLLRNRMLKWPETLLEPAAGGQSALVPPGSAAPIEQFQPPQIASWVIYAISLVILLILFTGMYVVYRIWERQRARRSSTMDAIANIARTSLADLSGGREWGDVVTEAYARMNEAVRLTRGLQREVSSTPREFAGRLARAGLPASAIEELTYLFESVRYGARTSDLDARRRAAACLESILHACGVMA
jgi:hypothetical protein